MPSVAGFEDVAFCGIEGLMTASIRPSVSVAFRRCLPPVVFWRDVQFWFGTNPGHEVLAVGYGTVRSTLLWVPFRTVFGKLINGIACPQPQIG